MLTSLQQQQRLKNSEKRKKRRLNDDWEEPPRLADNPGTMHVKTCIAPDKDEKEMP